jgi:hypothetical protein
MINFLASIIVFTANILGSFQDPFEFDGDYGAEMNGTRNKVFELVIPKQEPEILFSELIPVELASKIPTLATFLEGHGNENVFPYLRQCPKQLLKLDQILRFQAASRGELLNLSILSSAYPLEGSNSSELKAKLMEQLFTDEIIKLVSPTEISDKRYQMFQSPRGQVLFYWLYQSLNLHLICQDPGLIDEINKTKSLFLKTIGDPQRRAEIFREKIQGSSAEVLFTQEGDPYATEALTADGLFLLPQEQIAQDGTLVFLKRDAWDLVDVIRLESYPEYRKGRVNLVLATHKLMKQKFLLASCHGHSTKPEDARLQIALIMDKFDELSIGSPGLQLLIGIDANTKSEKDVEALMGHLDELGLVATEVGPTTIKKRMVTVQHEKAGRLAMDQEDYLITLKPERGGLYNLANPVVGFQKGEIDPSQPLPNLDNLSDHYPVGAALMPNAF